jgi:outer membrane receptor protein involved in Fe transport
MKRIFIGIIFVVFAVPVFAQEPSRGYPNQMPAEGIITGVVLEEDLNQPMEFVNLVLFRVRDSSMVTGTITNLEGKFTLTGVPFGRFYLVANFIGYNHDTVTGIVLTPQSKTADIQTIKLKSASTDIQGVEVVSDKLSVEYRIDKKIVNVGQDLIATGGSAVTALENVPSIQVDIEGNVTMRGSGSFTVLIDGRPSVLQGGDALQQIPASSVDRIEIITNPSAKYDPDGLAGIINVVMKKQQKPGYNGILNASIGTNHKYTADFLLNYRTGKFNLFGGADYNNNRFDGSGNSRNEYYFTDSTSFRFSGSERNMNRHGYGVKAGLDYFLSDKTTLTLSGRIGEYGFGSDGFSHQHLYSEPVSDDSYIVSTNQSEREGHYYEGTLNLTQKFKGDGHQLEAMAFYSTRNGDDWDEQEEFISDASWVIADTFPEKIRTTENSDEYNIRFKADYTKPFTEKRKIEAGLQSRIEDEKEDYIFYDYDYDLNDWLVNDLYTSVMDFDQQIYSAYGIYSDALWGFDYQVGMRGEYTYQMIKSGGTGKTYLIDRLDYFPSIHISRQITEDHQLLASYSRRIERPDGRELDPFITYMDPFNIRTGNPALEPEFIDSYDLSYQYKFKKSFLSLEGYYRITKNKITHVQALLDNGIMLHSFENLDKDFSTGSELMANLDLTKWLLVNASFNVYYYRLIGSVEGESKDEHSTNWDTRLNATFKLKHDIRIQLTGSYRGPSVTIQGTEEGFLMTNLAIRKDFFKRSLAVTLTGRDLFKTAKREMTSSGEGFYSYNKFKREAPVVSLSLSYKINNYKQQQQRNGEREEMQEENGFDF